MLDYLNSFIIYSYNDMSLFIVQSLGKQLGMNFFLYPEVASSLNLIDILSSKIVLLFFKYFQVYTAINLIGILYFILNFIITYLLLRGLINSSISKITSFLFALFYVTSNYFLYRIISFTPNLYPLFIFPLILYLLQLKKTHPSILSLVLIPMFLLSAYYGFFSLLLIGSWYLFDLISSKERLNSRIKLFTTNLFFIITPLLIFILVFLLPLVRYNQPITVNKINSDSTNVSPSSSNPEINQPGIRSIDDYYNMSFRPWYFVIPPNNSVLFGDLSRSIYQNIKDTGYFLADDYSELEAGGSYIGWHFIVSICLILYLIVFKYKDTRVVAKFKILFQNRSNIIRYLFIILVLILLSQPPSFTISGYTIYTPSYVLYYIVPAFRGLVRLSSVIYLLVLLINYYFIVDLYNIFLDYLVSKRADLNNHTFRSAYIVVFLSTFILLHYALMLVRVPVINTKQAPADIAFLAQVGGDNQIRYVVYPKGDYSSIFWITNHKQVLVNPIDLNYKISGLDTKEFSKQLPTNKGINNLISLEVDYLLIHKDKLTPEDYESTISFFLSNINFVVVFEDDNSIIFQIIASNK